VAVFTPVSDDQARAFLRDYDLGDLVALHPIAEGVENTNYRLETVGGCHVLTLFEARTDAASLPFCLGLTDHLAARGYPAPRPLRRQDGGWIGTLNGRPAAVIEWLEGVWLRAPASADLTAAGTMLARLHLAAADFRLRRDNPVGPAAWRALADRSATSATSEDRAILDDAQVLLSALGDPFTDDLPADLAIALSAWGFDATGEPIAGAVDAFRHGYEAVRPLSPAESAALPRLGQAAALRFTLTRLHDRVFHDPTKLVTPKDPAAFLRRAAWWRTYSAAGPSMVSGAS
jgi:homoserine kinase type II